MQNSWTEYRGGEIQCNPPSVITYLQRFTNYCINTTLTNKISDSQELPNLLTLQ